MLATLRVRSARNFPSLSIASSPSVTIVAALRVGQERFAAIRCPLHRPSQLARRIAGQHVLGIEERLHAEAAADIGRDDAEFRRFGLEHRAEQVLDQPAALRVGVQRPAIGGRIVVGDRGARFHGCDDDAVVHHCQAGDVRGRGEQRIGRRLVADLPVERDVALHVRPDEWRGGVGDVRQIGDRRLHVVVHRHQFGRVARGRGGFGDDERDGVADMAHGAVGERQMRRVRHVGAVAVLHRRGAGQRADAVGVQVGRGIDCLNPGDRCCRLGVDRAEFRRGVRAAQHDTVQHARQHDIVGVAPVRPSAGAGPPRGGQTGRGRTWSWTLSPGLVCGSAAKHARSGRERPRAMQDRRLCVLNAGSSSLKFAVYGVADSALHRLQSGEVEKIGGEGRLLIATADGKPTHDSMVTTKDHADALAMLAGLPDGPLDRQGLMGFGHRVVHGGPDLDAPRGGRRRGARAHRGPGAARAAAQSARRGRVEGVVRAVSGSASRGVLRHGIPSRPSGCGGSICDSRCALPRGCAALRLSRAVLRIHRRCLG